MIISICLISKPLPLQLFASLPFYLISGKGDKNFSRKFGSE